jgi:hypothetical protein
LRDFNTAEFDCSLFQQNESFLQLNSCLELGL